MLIQLQDPELYEYGLKLLSKFLISFLLFFYVLFCFKDVFFHR